MERGTMDLFSVSLCFDLFSQNWKVLPQIYGMSRLLWLLKGLSGFAVFYIKTLS